MGDSGDPPICVLESDLSACVSGAGRTGVGRTWVLKRREFTQRYQRRTAAPDRCWHYLRGLEEGEGKGGLS